jgi:hypothetical protein
VSRHPRYLQFLAWLAGLGEPDYQPTLFDWHFLAEIEPGRISKGFGARG